MRRRVSSCAKCQQEKPIVARGLCDNCWHWCRYHDELGKYPAKYADVPKRFRASYAVDSHGCWIWQKEILWNGYGRISVQGKQILAHRYSYELHVGVIAPSYTIDHLCKVRSCVNPAHLEAVTMRENIMRGNGAAARAHRTKTAKEVK